MRYSTICGMPVSSIFIVHLGQNPCQAGGDKLWLD
jgi:hypothetical protein